jgi:DNA helicase TIP49 (TBP-interacting protein)
MAQTQGRNEIEKSDVEEVKALFFDAKASAKLLHE